MKQLVFILTTIWIAVSGGATYALSRMWFSSYYASIPCFLVGWFIVAWTGVAIISMLNPDVRLANKIGIKVENLSIYQEAYNIFISDKRKWQITYLHGYALPNRKEWEKYLSYMNTKIKPIQPDKTKPSEYGADYFIWQDTGKNLIRELMNFKLRTHKYLPPYIRERVFADLDKSVDEALTSALNFELIESYQELNEQYEQLVIDGNLE